MANPKKKVVRRRRERKNIEKGAVHIRSSFTYTSTLFRPQASMAAFAAVSAAVWAA